MFSLNERTLLALGEREIKASPDISSILFHTKASREASRTFVAWLRKRGGRATKREMSEFANSLNGFSRSNFYALLRVFINAGLIAVVPEFDHETKKVRQTYRIVTQPIAKRRPAGPSLILNAHLAAEIWNRQVETSFTCPPSDSNTTTRPGDS